MDVVYEIDQLKKKLANLERSYLQSQRNVAPLTDKTDDAMNKLPQIDTNTEDIATNAEDIVMTQEGLAETYEEMNSSILEVEEALAEVYEMIIG